MREDGSQATKDWENKEPEHSASGQKLRQPLNNLNRLAGTQSYHGDSGKGKTAAAI